MSTQHLLCGFEEKKNQTNQDDLTTVFSSFSSQNNPLNNNSNYLTCMQQLQIMGRADRNGSYPISGKILLIL